MNQLNWTISSLIMAISLNTMASKDSVQKIPFELDDSFIFVNANLSNKDQEHKYRLLFDLGDYRAISLTEKVLQTVPHKKLDRYDTFQDYKGDVFKAQQFQLPVIKLGEVVYESKVGSEDIQDSENLSPSPFGAIGAGLFSNQTLTINFREQILEVSEQSLQQCYKFDPASGAIVTEVELNGQRGLFIIDTGTKKTVINKESSVINEPTDTLVAQSFKTKDFVINDFPVQVIDLNIPGIDGILGQDVLKQHALTVDFKNNCFKFS
ncbi:retropepsin-like aspartic protease [Pleionea sediminis]|uniref:retropepsin-like aspartic protease n=1 Tax=Pleionea sediminis TaxID=2569479 RepID=UPI0011870F65|nr:retropepsin-like aspartic protease [Pleionea sediminis]